VSIQASAPGGDHRARPGSNLVAEAWRRVAEDKIRLTTAERVALFVKAKASPPPPRGRVLERVLENLVGTTTAGTPARRN
jgi:hypothetical protein